MAVLSARFAVLACLCAVIPFTPSVEAAHIYGGHSMEKHASFHQSPRSNNPSFSGGSTTSHKHHEKDHEHPTHDHRTVELPPLLRRYHVHDHDHRGSNRHDGAHDQVPRSAFARNRYRQEPSSHSRRSSVYVPGEHGNTYLVSRTSYRNWDHAYADTDRESFHAYIRRQVDESNLAFGRIDIMSAQSSGGTQHLASLTIDSTPIDWTSGQTSAKAFPLNASTTNQTQFIMIPMDDSSAGGSSNKHVTLATQVFDASSAEMVMYCATYDPDPGKASALLMTPCTGTTRPVSPADDAADPCTDDDDDASSSNPHQSQIFSYDPSSGKIEPMSATGNATGVGSSADTSTPCAGAKVRRDTSNSTTGGSARASGTSTSITPTASAFQQAKNVTLVYVAGALEVPAASPSLSAGTTFATATTTAKTGASIGQAAVFTTTITTTVVATVTTASGMPTHSATPAQAAASVSTPSTPSPPTAVPTPSVLTTTTRSSLSSSSTASSTGASTTLAPAKADESLEVEVVAVTPSTTAGASTTSATGSTATTMTTITSYSSGSASPTLDAAAVASSIANQMPHRRRAMVIVGASVTPVV